LRFPNLKNELFLLAMCLKLVFSLVSKKANCFFFLRSYSN
jgi:hypothetical protein